MNANENNCPQCGSALPHDAPGGLCPSCLMQMNLADPTIMSAESAQGKMKPKAPSVEEIAPLFPQLEILELIGQGGMGAVYKARQKELDRIVALKILPQEIGETPGFAERFTREARALAKLNHSGIVTLYEFGKADGLYFFLMEYVDGLNLRHLLRNGRIEPREALAIVPQICDALQYAHDHGIVHRDIKPENILLDRLGNVKVADFGLAKIVEKPLVVPPSDEQLVVPPLGGLGASKENRLKPELQTEITEDGKVMGTPKYMSPEQVEAPGTVDHRADIYALGVVFYQMLTGEMPDKELTPPSQKVRIDVRLDEVVLRALESKPDLRYQQASILKTDVETIVSDAATSEESDQKKSGIGETENLNGKGFRRVQRIIIIRAVVMCIVAAVFGNSFSSDHAKLALLGWGILGMLLILWTACYPRKVKAKGVAALNPAHRFGLIHSIGVLSGGVFLAFNNEGMTREFNMILAGMMIGGILVSLMKLVPSVETDGKIRKTNLIYTTVVGLALFLTAVFFLAQRPQSKGNKQTEPTGLDTAQRTPSAAVSNDVSHDFEVFDSGLGIRITGYTGSGGNVVIPDTIDGKPVTQIGDSVFAYCTSLTEVVIPDSVNSIFNSAFLQCTSLTNVVIGSGVTSIDNEAFAGCTSLKEVVIPYSVTHIGDSAFSFCSGLTNMVIPSSVTSIGKEAFYKCIGLTEVMIPKSVTTIPASAFSGCTSLKKVVIPDSVNSIGNNAFRECTGLTEIVIPDSVTSIGHGMFYECTGLKEVVIPDSVTTIGDSAFYFCTNLTNLVIGNGVATIENSAFQECTGLTEVVIPGSITNFGVAVFDHCEGLTHVVIGSGVATIGQSTFYCCRSLTEVVIPDSVTNIDDKAFFDCNSLTKIVIPDSVTTIGEDAFFDCDGLTEVYFQGNAPTAPDDVFVDCGTVYNLNAPTTLDDLFVDCPTNGTVYYLAGTTGWGDTFGGWPTALYDPAVGGDGIRNPEQETASVMESCLDAAQKYSMAAGVYPAALSDLLTNRWDGPYIKSEDGAVLDEWGNILRYQLIGTPPVPQIRSAGADQTFDTVDDVVLSYGGDDTSKYPVSLFLSAEGTLMVNGKPCLPNQKERMLKQLVDAGVKAATIHIDQTTSFEKTKDLVSACRRAGVEELTYVAVSQSPETEQLRNELIMNEMIKFQVKVFELEPSVSEQLSLLDVEKLEDMAGVNLICDQGVTSLSGTESTVQMTAAAGEESSNSFSPSLPGTKMTILPKFDGYGAKYDVKLEITRRESKNGDNVQSSTKELVFSGNAPLGETVMLTFGEISDTQTLVALLKFDSVDPEELRLPPDPENEGSALQYRLIGDPPSPQIRSDGADHIFDIFDTVDDVVLSSGGIETINEPVPIFLSAEGTLMVNGKPCLPNQKERMLKQLVDDGIKAVVIHTDRTTSFFEMKDLIDACKQAGIEKISFAVISQFPEVSEQMRLTIRCEKDRTLVTNSGTNAVEIITEGKRDILLLGPSGTGYFYEDTPIRIGGVLIRFGEQLEVLNAGTDDLQVTYIDSDGEERTQAISPSADSRFDKKAPIVISTLPRATNTLEK